MNEMEISDILVAYYNNTCGGHFVVASRHKEPFKLYFWPTLFIDSHKDVSRCVFVNISQITTST